MAAGRHANPRRELSHRPRSSAYAYEIETGYGRDQYPGGRSIGQSDSRSRIHGLAGRGEKVRKSEEVKELPPAKKSKFSPVKWDKEDSGARVSYRDETPLLNDKLRQNGDVNINSVSVDVNDVCDDVDATDKLQDVPKSDVEFRSAESVVTESPTLSALSSFKERRFNKVDVRDAVLVEDEMQVDDVGHTSSLHISKSRWASDDDSPVRKFHGNKENESGKAHSAERHSSPECGEFIRDDSEGGRSGSIHDDIMVDDSGAVNEEEYCDPQGDEDNNSPSGGEENEIIEVPRNAIWDGCKCVFDYERLNKINEGTYGVVYRARHKLTGEIVALKKVKLEGEREGFPITALREIKFLMAVDHPSIVRGKEIVMGDLDSVFVVMEYMEHDLKALMEVMKHPFSISEVKCLMLQLLEGIQHLHDNWVIHRDLKSSNILFNNQGELKICDFGMARQYANPLKPYTALVVTLWYRAPEILFGAKQYSEAVDMWSVGCIMAELLRKEPLFQGKTEVDQIDKIVRLLGTPNETIWPGFLELPEAKKAKFAKQPYNMLRKKFPVTSFTGAPALSDAGFDLLNRMLTYDPVKRITVHEALNHPWFKEVPMAKAKEFMPTYPAQNAKDRSGKHAPRK